MPRVKDEMVKEPVWASVPAGRRELLQLFVRHGHAGFPVVKEGTRKLVGLVTRQELFQHPDESQVSLLMNPNPATTYPEAPVREAARLVVERGLRVLPVVTGANDLVGVVTPRELLAALPAPHAHVAVHLRRYFVPAHRATPARVALEIFRATRVTALPVLDDDGRVEGMLGDAELLAHLRVADATVRTVAGLAGDGDDWAWEALRDERRIRHATTHLELPARPIADLMARGPPTIGPNAPLREAIDLLFEHRVHQLAVVDEDGLLLGVLSEIDVLGAALS